ncbi:MAG: hypothetical protein ABMA64_28620 [Myxococcota bacterium]
MTRGVQLQTYSPNPSYVWLTDFVLAAGLSLADVNLFLRSVSGSFQAKPVYQTATVRAENPDTPTVFPVGALTSAPGYTLFHQPLAFSGSLLVRFGLVYQNSSGTALGSAWADAPVAVRQCASVVASGRSLVQPGATSTTDVNYVPLGDFQPAVGLDKVMGAFVVLDNEGQHLEYQLAIRSAKDVRAPNPWFNAEGTVWSNPAVPNTERNTTSITLPTGVNLTNSMFFQMGLAYRKKSGATGNPRAQISAVTAGIYA